MVQERYLDYEAPNSTELLNGKWQESEGKYVARGLEVSTSVEGPWRVDISSGAAVLDGVLVAERDPLEGEVQLSSAQPSDGHPRYDTVVMEYEYEALESGGTPPKASYSVRKGAPTEEPTPPNTGPNELKLADIYVPPGTTELNSQNISNVARWADGPSNVYSQGEASKTFTADGMKEALLNFEGLFTWGSMDERPEPWRYPGIVYLCTDVGVAFYSDGTTWQYKGSQWSAGTEEERPPAEAVHQFYVRLNSDKSKVLSLDWSDGDSWHSASLGEGDYAEVGHGNEDHGPTFLTAAGTHGNVQHNPDFAEAPHGNDAHSFDLPAEEPVVDHTHGNEDLEDIDADGDGAGSGLDADLLDGMQASDFQPAGDYASGSHDNNAHSEDYITQITVTEQYNAGQQGPITSVPSLAPPVPVDTDCTVKSVIVMAGSSPNQDVTGAVRINGSTFQEVTLPAGTNYHEDDTEEGAVLAVGDVVQFGLLDSNEEGQDFAISLLVEEVLDG